MFRQIPKNLVIENCSYHAISVAYGNNIKRDVYKYYIIKYLIFEKINVLKVVLHSF